MTEKTQGVCGAKGCANNTVFGRKYCNNCEQKRKEKAGRRAATAVGTGALGLAVYKFKDPALKILRAVMNRAL